VVPRESGVDPTKPHQDRHVDPAPIRAVAKKRRLIPTSFHLGRLSDGGRCRPAEPPALA